MSKLNNWTSSEGANLLSRNPRTSPHGALLAANTRAQAEIGMPSDSARQDVRGQTLRLLRMQQNWDAAVLATQACISLRQLYQLENGETTLFYSPSLRNQAGRRVTALLGAKWDELGQAPAPAPAAAVQDKALKLVQPQPAAVEMAPASAPAPVSFQTQAPAEVQTPVQTERMPVGLDKPAVDTVVEPPAVTAKLNAPESELAAAAPAKGLHPIWTLTGWLVSALSGAGTGWLLATEWGVRLSLNV